MHGHLNVKQVLYISCFHLHTIRRRQHVHPKRQYLFRNLQGGVTSQNIVMLIIITVLTSNVAQIKSDLTVSTLSDNSFYFFTKLRLIKKTPSIPWILTWSCNSQEGEWLINWNACRQKGHWSNQDFISEFFVVYCHSWWKLRFSVTKEWLKYVIFKWWWCLRW